MQPRFKDAMNTNLVAEEILVKVLDHSSALSSQGGYDALDIDSLSASHAISRVD